MSKSQKRVCKRCGETKPLDKDHFPAHSSGYKHECKKCKNAKQREEYATNPDYRESILQRERSNRENPEKWARIQEYHRRPEVRSRKNERALEEYHNNPELRSNQLARQKARWDNDPEWRESTKAKWRERRASDPEWREKDNARQRERRAADPLAQRNQKERDLQKRYGITLMDYERREAEQNGLCAICQLEPEGSLEVDHNHRTGQVRGLLCSNCNFGIGIFEENPRILRNAIPYLSGPSMRPQDIQTIPDERMFARFHIPYWKGQSRDRRYRLLKDQNLRKFGINIDQYEWLLEKGNGVCWICFRPEEQKSNEKSPYNNTLSVDHNHLTGMIRGLLCSSCNFGVGKFRDSSVVITSAIAYLKIWETGTMP